MKRKIFDVAVILAVVALIAFQIPAVSQSVLEWSGVLPQIYSGTSGTEHINVGISAYMGATIDSSGNADFPYNVEMNGFIDTPYQDVAASSYTLDADSKAAVYGVDYTTTGAVSFILGTDAVVDGRHVWIYDEDGNAGTNNITLSTEGSETINGAATYAMDADNEAVHIFSDGSNWFVLGGYAE